VTSSNLDFCHLDGDNVSPCQLLDTFNSTVELSNIAINDTSNVACLIDTGTNEGNQDYRQYSCDIESNGTTIVKCVGSLIEDCGLGFIFLSAGDGKLFLAPKPQSPSISICFGCRL